MNRALTEVVTPTVHDHFSDTALALPSNVAITSVSGFGVLPVVAAAAPALGKLGGLFGKKRKKPKAPRQAAARPAGGEAFSPAVVGLTVGLLALGAIVIFTLGSRKR